MKKNNRNMMLLMSFLLILFVFCSCTVTVDFAGTKYDIVIENNVAFSIKVNINGGTSYVIISAGGHTTLNLREGTAIEVCRSGDPLTRFAVQDTVGDYTFVLDGAGYTLSAETGCLSPYCLWVMRVL